MPNRTTVNWILLVASAMMIAGLPACKNLKLLEGRSRDPKDMPGARKGYLTAKVAACLHAMENMPPESKRYGDDFYIASGIYDADPSHAKVLVAALQGMDPPVMEVARLYTRDENSTWLDGKPAIVWTAKVQRVTENSHAFLIVGWMHSNLLYEFFEYETRYLKRDDSWEVVDYRPLEGPY